MPPPPSSPPDQLRGLLEAHPVTTLLVVLSAAFVIGFEPVWASVTDLASLTMLLEWGFSWSTAEAMALWSWVLFLVFTYFCALLLSRVHADDSVDAWLWAPSILPAPLRALLLRAEQLPARVLRLTAAALRWPLVRLLGERTRGQRTALGALLVASGGTVLLAAELGQGFEYGSRLLFVLAWMSMLGLLGAWLLLSRFEARPVGAPPGPWTEVAGSSLTLLGLSAVCGSLLYLAASSGIEWPLWRFYTLWCVYHVCLLFLLVGRVADATGRTVGERLAVGSLALVVVVVAVCLPVPVGYPDRPSQPTLPGASRRALVDLATWDGEVEAGAPEALPPGAPGSPQLALIEGWFGAVEARLARLPPDSPVLMVAAAGGGARAGQFALLVLQGLERIHPDDDPTGPSLGDRVLFVSSVSGGSMAAAHFRFGAEAPGEEKEPHNTSPDELGRHVVTELRGRVRGQDQACAAERQRLGREDGRACRVLAELKADLLAAEQVGGPDGLPAEVRARSWPLRSALLDDLSTDFNAPLLRGLVFPGLERGEAVTDFWRSEFGWQDRYFAQRKDPTQSRGPLLLINLTDVNQGTRIVAGFPRLPAGLLGPTALAPDRDPSTRTARPDAAALTDLDPALAVDVEEAVRMSANFPYGFDLPLLGLGDPTERVRVVDGGVLDNSGIDTFEQLFVGLQRLADPGSAGGAPPELVERAEWLLAELARRGVVLVEVDAGAKPEAPGSLSQVLANVLLPIHSLSAAGFVRAGEATEQHVSSMDAVLRRAARPPSAAAELDPSARFRSKIDLLGIRLKHHIFVLDTAGLMTAWGLTPRQKGQLVGRFIAENALQRDVLKDSLGELARNGRAAERLGRDARTDDALAILLDDLTQGWARMQVQDRNTLAAQAEQRRAAYASPEGDGRERADNQPLRAIPGWIFAGYRPDATDPGDPPPDWLLARLDLEDRGLPDPKADSRLSVRLPVLLRPSFPSDKGRLGAGHAVLSRGEVVKLLELREWRQSGLWFACVVAADTLAAGESGDAERRACTPEGPQPFSG